MTNERSLDPRFLRFQGVVVATALLAAFVFGYDWVLPALAILLAAAGIGGRAANLIFFVYDVLLAPRLPPATREADRALVRFSTLFAAAVLGVATALLAVGLGGLAWLVALALAMVEAVSAVAAIPLSRFIYERFGFRRR